jgi:hypothetical protein
LLAIEHERVEVRDWMVVSEVEFHKRACALERPLPDVG